MTDALWFLAWLLPVAGVCYIYYHATFAGSRPR